VSRAARFWTFACCLVVALAGPTFASTGQASEAGAEERPANRARLAGMPQMDAGGEHSCGIRGNGTLWCWGRNNYGQIGNGKTGTDVPSPVQVAR
jgi:hypothetical protein